MRAALAAAILSVAPAAADLMDSGAELIQRLVAQGYESVLMKPVILEMLQPCTLSVYTPWNSGGGFFVGVGGRHVLDLYLRVEGDSWMIEDTLPDDLPVIELSAGEVHEVRRVILEAMDMTGGATTDSALFFYALSQVDLLPAGGDLPAGQEQTGVD
jgi:hypothetical protein